MFGNYLTLLNNVTLIKNFSGYFLGNFCNRLGYILLQCHVWLHWLYTSDVKYLKIIAIEIVVYTLSENVWLFLHLLSCLAAL